MREGNLGRRDDVLEDAMPDAKKCPNEALGGEEQRMEEDAEAPAETAEDPAAVALLDDPRCNPISFVAAKSLCMLGGA